jgi:microcystin-dependent protein
MASAKRPDAGVNSNSIIKGELIMSEPFVGEIKMVGFNFAPRGYALCNGQILSIAQNTALFSLLGTMYGGNGQTTFALPNLQGRVPVHQGQGAGLSNYTIGQNGGEETHTLITTEMPLHNHTATATTTVSASSTAANATSPANNFLANSGRTNIYSNTPPDVNMGSNPATATTSVTVQSSGGSAPHNNLQPYLCVNFVIALEGIFPSRN